MTSFFLLAQAAQPELGWLSSKLLGVTLGSAEWVLWLLVSLSIISIAVMLERAVYFSRHRLANSEALAVRLARGEFDAVAGEVKNQKGMEASVIREALASAQQGPDTVEQVIASTVARERPQYERGLSILGTLGNNAPFIGLFGTVLGIIKAFNDLGAMNAKGGAMQQTVMAGISEALVATAVGLAVAIPAVVAFNIFNRQLKTLTSRTTALGHALVGAMKARKPGAAGGN
ncbi:MotA/TolQ/ExbB proton channel family protein [Corallococcus exiguus]|uniref:MotA/TolQ/ExbB proton channel family protein n=1 Tax=Corallococcus exiguus TaxID=83462 RepID=A0A7Y1RUT4_9BACT|nr:MULTISPECIES: MotA/TolQ/ExbB proton channel family protein [Corallococcus]NBC42223.1 MotA/TolQ/ExbB proton channel family protein [Corallococcus exiguus]NNB91005.1 MotA/TolQ/ExbB proton channel family protein [Corallococcus exiguus]NNB98974.1 MotA/TolQ/ExbB proton channel family protein [Corallococcus exiguus]NNC21105.1 MotA/TolQ/ExbB proton channel family protein [Corallococcus exiguus]NPC52048.1 MotA/TolQ/ExbB proton channel family protein [Corallococcus exiguus]